MRCEGAGELPVEMHFLTDVFVRCPACRGARLRPEAPFTETGVRKALQRAGFDVAGAADLDRRFQQPELCHGQGREPHG